MSCEDTVCGIGGWNGPKPGDPNNNISLSATTVFGGIDVSWSYPTVNPQAVAHTLLFRGVSNVFSSSMSLGVVSGSIYFDKISVQTNTTYFYWIQIVSVNGTVGDLIGPASAMARPIGDQTLESLTGRIDAGVLANALRTKIDGIAHFGEELLAEIAKRLAGNAELSAAIAAVSSSTGEALTYVHNEITQRTTADAALVHSVNAIAAGLNGNTAAIIEERTVRVTRDESVSNALQILYNNFGTNTAAIISERESRATAIDAVSTQINYVSAATGANAAAISSEQVARSDAVNALATNISLLYSKVANAEATIRDESITRASADAAGATRLTTAESSLNGNIAAVQTGLQTDITTVNGKVTNIGALYTAKVNVNGLVGGFGVYNDGRSVEAGFDVDTFWVGRTNANKVKPFIISNGVTYIDSARIRDADISTLKIAGNAVTLSQYWQAGTGSIPTGASSSVNLINVGYMMPANASASIFIVSIKPASASAALTAYARIKLNGVYLNSTGVSVQGGYVGSLVLLAVGYPVEGFNSVEVEGYNSFTSTAWTAQEPTLILMGGKR